MTREKFCAYENVRRSGVTNMYDINYVINEAMDMYDTELTREDCLDIMKNYVAYHKKFWVKSKQAVALGRKGGKASAKSLTPKQREERGRKAVQARWKKLKAKKI